MNYIQFGYIQIMVKKNTHQFIDLNYTQRLMIKKEIIINQPSSSFEYIYIYNYISLIKKLNLVNVYKKIYMIYIYIYIQTLNSIPYLISI